MNAPAKKHIVFMQELTGHLPLSDFQLRRCISDIKAILRSTCNSDREDIATYETCLGIAYARLRQEDDAVAAHGLACRYSSNPAHAHNFAVTLSLFHRNEEALEKNDLALRLAGEDRSDLLSSRAGILYELGRTDESKAVFKQALSCFDGRNADNARIIAENAVAMKLEDSARLLARFIHLLYCVPDGDPLDVIARAPADTREWAMDKLGLAHTLGEQDVEGESMAALEKKKLDEFLHALPEQLAAKARAVLESSREFLGEQAPLPIITREDDDTLAIEWSLESGYVQLSIEPTGEIQWFYKIGDEYGGSDDESLTEVPQDVFSALQRIAG